MIMQFSTEDEIDEVLSLPAVHAIPNLNRGKEKQFTLNECMNHGNTAGSYYSIEGAGKGMCRIIHKIVGPFQS